VHVIALSLAAGTAFVKLLLVFRCKKDYTFYIVYFKLAPLLSKLIITGMILLTLSGIAFIITGYSVAFLLILKIIIVAGIWIIGPIIDSRAEPKVKKLYPSPGAQPSAAFTRAHQQHLLLEIIATIMMYAALIIGVLL
jgi:Na+-transporting methylmalonyl-CoA/oxaloacetate decarboxylase gamma subunit